MESEAYDALAHEEDQHWWFEGRRRIVRDLLHTHLRPHADRRILDVGCGTGGMYPLLSQFGRTEGADGSDLAIAYATQRFPDFKVSKASLPASLPDDAYDLITAFDVIEHLDEPVACLRTMRRHLAPAGQIVVTVPAYAMLWSKHDEIHHHKRRYRKALLAAQLAEAGLRPVYMTHFNTWLLPPIAAVRIASRLLPGASSSEQSSPEQSPSAKSSSAKSSSAKSSSAKSSSAKSSSAKSSYAGAGNLKETAGTVNKLLTWLFASERMALRLAPLPAGVSIFAVAEPAARGAA